MYVYSIYIYAHMLSASLLSSTDVHTGMSIATLSVCVGVHTRNLQVSVFSVIVIG